MAEERHHHLAITIPVDTRPQTARKGSRKVPGGFSFDDVDDLSPDKETVDDSIFANALAHQENTRVPPLDPSTLPSLPPPTDSSFLYYNNQSGSGQGSDAHPDTLDEGELHKHLNDIESSFVAAPETIGFQDSKGWDDTYLFDGAQRPEPPKSPSRGSSSSQNHTSSKSNIPPSPPTPENAYKTPGLISRHSDSQETTMDVGNTTSSLETLSSSPTAAAAARTVSRAISMASVGGDGEGREGEGDSSDMSLQDFSGNEDGGDTETTPTKDSSLLDSTDSRPSLRDRLSSQNLNHFISDAGSTPGAGLLDRNPSGKQPKFLRSRHASHHSSVSSIATNGESQDGSDVTLGADYALQSGGAVPAAGFSRSASMALSRSISLGSMASGIEDFSGESSGRALDASLATLTEEELNHERISGQDISPPETPRAMRTSRSMAAPTDTIIARHVRNVQVPESLAKEYRTKSGVSSPKRSGFAVSTLGRNGKNLTLKEQSSTIERLSKENFDLKLKVMFLSDRLDKLSEEGVKEMISENVELKTGLAVMQRDNKALKRKVKELEKQLKDDEERPSTAVSGTSAGDQPSPRWFDQEGAQEREEELLYLRERVEEYVTEIEKLRKDGLARENEKRNLAEVVRSMGERRGNLEAREEMDVWKDLLEQETAHREQVDEDNKKLREEIYRLKSETSSSSGVGGLSHTTNVYNITKKRAGSSSRPRSELSDPMEDRNLSAASTLVEELRKDCDQLRHENGELKREVSAQTSMLTSRNREKERLYQEIEDLKLAHRRGGSVAGDSILERSASRTHQRPASRASNMTRQANADDQEREDLENKNSELRDRINSLKIQNQDLQRELESCMEDFELAVEQKKQAEDLATELQEALEVAENDLLTIQAERDEALQGQDEAEHDFESLRKEAQEELDSYAAETEAARSEIERLQNDLADSTENFAALQNEMREMSESVVRLEDSDENKSRRIDDLERDLEDANRELEELEKSLQESNDKINHLSVQRESSQSEIAFLREEQDGDKIKIGDLEAGIRKFEQNLRDERERVAELEQRMKNERHQREILAGKKQSEVEKQFDRFNRENNGLRDEVQRLKTKLQTAAGDAAANAQKVLELETGLKQALGDLHGTKSSLVGSVNKLTSTLNEAVRDVDNLKRVLNEKDRLIGNKDEQLETQALELRRLADIAERERQAHRNVAHQFETYQKTTHHTSRTLTQQETRVSELESVRHNNLKRISSLENQLRDQTMERGVILLKMWDKLSALCGPEWAHNNSLINGRALPSLESITAMLPGFAKNLYAAVKTVETMMGDFKTRIHNVEKTLWKEYQTLEENLEVRTKRLDRLETMSRSAIPGVGGDGKAEIHKLRESNRALKTELSLLRAQYDVRSNVFNHQSPSPSIPTGPRTKSLEKTRASTMTRASSSSAVETVDRRSGTSNGSTRNAPTPSDDNKVWQLRLHEMTSKLKAEREGRLGDRDGAMQRLKDAEEQAKQADKRIRDLETELGRRSGMEMGR
ncbi:Anucleate primary sterigmata protein B [Lachnellula willkommii]|uniref:Anucleate primary sterigmata protein B n=1 Tax=Lachnellula willkommii TaxID=215461 RepID=A0A559M8D2_9HELO|nr:Anucleate primary sterigmata protein B [Lachnellula willkommii]